MRSFQPVCNKCRSGKQAEGANWCLGCSALEVSSTLLRRRWNNPGLRAIAEETLLSTAKLCRAFSNLDSNLLTAAAVDKGPLAAAKSRTDRPRSRTPLRDDRPPLRRQPPGEERRRSPPMRRKRATWRSRKKRRHQLFQKGEWNQRSPGGPR